GVVLYELLAGELPFRGNQRMLLQQVLCEEPRAPRKLNDRIPRDLETVCLKAMAKEPRKRYQTARALADDLRRFLNREPIQARPVGRVERLWRWCRRNPRLASLTAVVALLLLAVSVVSTLAAIQIAGARDEAKRHAENEGRARATAERNAEENRMLLSRQYVTNGVQLLEEGDLAGSLVWFTEALKRDPGNPEREGVLRTPTAPVLQHCPRPVQIWSPEGKVGVQKLSPDGRWLLTVGTDKTARVWDTTTGRPTTPVLEHDAATFRPVALFSPDSRRTVT